MVAVEVLHSISIAAGILMLLVGAETIVRAGSALAYRMGLSPLWIGLTIVAIGTSAPEIAVSIEAALNDAGPIAVGNVIGSNILNVLLVLGAIALIQPVSVDPISRKQDIPFLLMISAFVWVLSMNGFMDRWEGALFLGITVAYMVFLYRRERGHIDEEDEVPALKSQPVPFLILLVLGGLVSLLLGGNFVLQGAVGLADEAGLSERFIGVTVVAIGTSLPELAVGITGARRKQTDLVIGNIVGSNLFNLLLVLGAAGTVSSLEVPTSMIRIDFPVMIVAAILLFVVARKGVIGRVPGLLLVACYAAYLAFLLVEL